MNYKWTFMQTLERLALRNMRSANCGRPCPVAGRVVERMEAALAFITFLASLTGGN